MKKLLIGIIVAVVVVGGVACYIGFSNTSQVKNTVQTNQTNDNIAANKTDSENIKNTSSIAQGNVAVDHSSNNNTDTPVVHSAANIKNNPKVATVSKAATSNNNSNNSDTLPNNLSTIDVAAGQDYAALGDKAYKMGISVGELREIVYNAIKNKVPNSGYINLTKAQQDILLNGTKEQKEALVNELGPNKLLINVTYKTNLPTNEWPYPVYPENFARGKFYYSFLAAPLSKMAESVQNWATYSGMVDAEGNLLPVNTYNELCNTRSIYTLNINSGIPSYPLAGEINI